jgi:uncharacterized protein Smg (DUF494 family)
MYERIIEIIVFVMSELRHNKNINDINIEELEDLGYTSSEISAALSWLVDRMEFNDKFFISDQSTRPSSFRVLHDFERDIFTPEAWGEIIQLNTLGLVSNEMIESMIDRAAIMGIRMLDVDQVKTFVANSVFNFQNSSNDYGNRLVLLGNDSIN